MRAGSLIWLDSKIWQDIDPFSSRTRNGPPPGSPVFFTTPHTRSGRCSFAFSSAVILGSWSFSNTFFCSVTSTPARSCLYRTVSPLSRSGTTLSIFLIKIMSASCSLRFSISAPCPPGRKSNLLSAVRNGVPSGFAARVSVEDFCSE